MPSRREQIQSYQYLMQRVVNAFVAGEADPAMSPTRRLAGAGYASVMVAVLVLAVFGVIGLVKHGGNTSWQASNAVVIEKETGTRYVYRDGVLYPVANYSSAVLVIGQPATTVSVSRESLTGATRGPLIGIAGAPDALPPASRMSRSAWAMCAVAGHDSSGGATVSSQIMVGATPPGGLDLGDSALIVRENNSQKAYLVWNGHRYRVDSRQTFAAMGIDGQPRVLVDEAFLDTVPLGLPIVQPQVDNKGKASTALKNYLIGQLLTVTVGGSTTGYLVRANDIMPVTGVEQALILADPGTAAAYPNATPQAKAVQAAEVANVAKANRPQTDLDPPAQVPSMAAVDPDKTLCTTWADGQGAAKVLVNAGPQPEGAGIATNGNATDQVATRVVVPSGGGAVVRSAQSADTDSGQVFFVTDQGRRYALVNPAQLAWFGYGSVKPIELPSFVVARIPAGPGLDPRAAQRPLAG
ncbi:type VII secretion protein EccB [Dactylosporangium sp. NPDC049140]|uniref:type VII secretion protein EccB n=1 Tax=Dactylosporangium sp. NPDC049140 TaxID=3155647 RepID=UPI0033C5B22D